MKIVVTGGGTGGHIYPALAFIQYVKEVQPDAEFLYIGGTRGLENKILPQTDIPFETLQIQGFKRSVSFENVKTVYLFLKSVSEAKKRLKQFKPDVVIVDPPRTGLGTELIEMLKRVQPKTIVYVSCNPSTLAKNLKELTKKYRVDYIQPVDMFPQTSHVEAVVRLVRQDRPAKKQR